MRRIAAVALVVLAPTAVLAGCGGADGRPQLVVSAASSLQTALTQYGAQFKPATVRLSFGGSDELAAQIRAGSRVDVYAAANTKLPDQLAAVGLVELPVVFTANRLVLAVPAGSSRVKSLDGLTARGVKLAVGAATVPVGSYTRQVLAHLPSAERQKILANVRSEEPDVAGIVGKLTQGAVDAGFVYATDVRATQGALRAIPLPNRLQPTVRYAAAVVRGSAHLKQARAFVNGLRSGAGQAALRGAGFLSIGR